MINENPDITLKTLSEENVTSLLNNENIITNIILGAFLVLSIVFLGFERNYLSPQKKKMILKKNINKQKPTQIPQTEKTPLNVPYEWLEILKQYRRESN